MCVHIGTDLLEGGALFGLACICSCAVVYALHLHDNYETKHSWAIGRGMHSGIKALSAQSSGIIIARALCLLTRTAVGFQVSILAMTAWSRVEHYGNLL